MVDVYEYFMRKCSWGDINCFNPTVQAFLLAVVYYGFVANGSVSSFLDSYSANDIEKMVRALNEVGCTGAANILSDAVNLFEGGMIPQDFEERSKALCDIPEAFLDDLDKKSYEIDIASDCYTYLQKYKFVFLEAAN